MYAQAGLSLCWPHIPHCWKSRVAAHFLLSADFFSRLTTSKYFGSNIVRVSNSLSPDHARHCVRLDLGLNCLQRLSADFKVVAEGIEFVKIVETQLSRPRSDCPLYCGKHILSTGYQE